MPCVTRSITLPSESSQLLAARHLGSFREWSRCHSKSRQLNDAVRLELAGDLRIEKSVNDGNGKRMMEKLRCFYQFLDKNGAVLSGESGSELKGPAGQASAPSDGAAPSATASVQGRYVRKDKASDFIEFKPNGAFSLYQDGQSVSGTWKVQEGRARSTLASGQRAISQAMGRLLRISRSSLPPRELPPHNRAGRFLQSQDTFYRTLSRNDCGSLAPTTV
jgi:hypothetical protein